MVANTFSVMSFNAGLAGWNVLGMQIDIVPETETRYEKIREFLVNSATTHDAICLQEVFGSYRDRLSKDITLHFPHVYTHPNSNTGLVSYLNIPSPPH